MTRICIKSDDSIESIRNCLEKKGIDVKIIAGRVVAFVPKGSDKSPEDEVTDHMNDAALSGYVSRLR